MMDDDPTTQGYRDLTCALIRRAVKDAQRGQPCDGRCRPGKYHICGAEARAFLQSEWCAFALEALGILRPAGPAAGQLSQD